MKVWVFLGWVVRDVRVEFEMPPRAEVHGATGRPVALGEDVQVDFSAADHTLAYWRCGP